jgi:Immunoglobulin-like domain of bacterial spore germination
MAKPKVTKRTLWLIAAGLVLLVVIVAVASSRQGRKTAGNEDPYRPKAEEGKATEPSSGRNPQAGEPTPIPTNSEPQSSKGGEITITAPTQGATVTSGTTVKGSAKTGASRIYYRLKGGKSGQLALGSINFSGDANTPISYSFELAFANQVAGGSDQGVLEVFTLGANGEEQTKASVTVNISG